MLAACGKLPLCPADASKYVAAASTPPALYPISALHFIDTEADVPQYVQFMQTYAQGLNTIEALILEEETQFQATIKRVQQLKEDAIKLVTKELDLVGKKLTALHTSVAQKLVNVKSDINIAKVEREARLGSTSQLLLDCSGKKTAEFYSPFVVDFMAQLKLTLHCQDIPTDADNYFKELFQRAETLKPSNTATEIAQKPPAKAAETPRKRPAALDRRCSICSGELEEVFHQCKEAIECLDCLERAIATACFGGRAACPGCGGVPLEVYRHRGMKECVFCSRKLRLTEVAHWCDDNTTIVCEKCIARVIRSGQCRKCGHSLARRSDK